MIIHVIQRFGGTECLFVFLINSSYKQVCLSPRLIFYKNNYYMYLQNVKNVFQLTQTKSTAHLNYPTIYMFIRLNARRLEHFAFFLKLQKSRLQQNEKIKQRRHWCSDEMRFAYAVVTFASNDNPRGSAKAHEHALVVLYLITRYE